MNFFASLLLPHMPRSNWRRVYWADGLVPACLDKVAVGRGLLSCDLWVALSPPRSPSIVCLRLWAEVIQVVIALSFARLRAGIGWGLSPLCDLLAFASCNGMSVIAYSLFFGGPCRALAYWPYGKQYAYCLAMSLNSDCDPSVRLPLTICLDAMGSLESPLCHKKARAWPNELSYLIVLYTH